MLENSPLPPARNNTLSYRWSSRASPAWPYGPSTHTRTVLPLFSASARVMPSRTRITSSSSAFSPRTLAMVKGCVVAACSGLRAKRTKTCWPGAHEKPRRPETTRTRRVRSGSASIVAIPGVMSARMKRKSHAVPQIPSVAQK